MAGGNLGAQEVAPIQNWPSNSTANRQYAAGQQQYDYGQPEYQQPPQYGQPQAYPQQQYPQQSNADPNEAYPPPPYQPNRALNPEQLEQLVAPIALYPDNLVSIVLAASTYPAQVSAADQWLRMQENAPPEQIAEEANAQTTWDPSIKALTAFPQVLEQMAANLQWTTDLGNAYYNQPQDVMQTIQVMRSRAQGAGTLQSTPQQQVTMDQGNIVLAPPSPQVVYVPMYDPWAVYGQPVAVYPGYSADYAALDVIGSTIQFGLGIAIQAFAGMPFGWFGWGLDWVGHAVLFDHGAYCTHSASVRDWGFANGGARLFHRGYERAGYGRGWGQGNGYLRPQPGAARGGERAFGGQSGRIANGGATAGFGHGGMNYGNGYGRSSGNQFGRSGQQQYGGNNHGPQPTGGPQQVGGRAFGTGSQGYVGRQQPVGRAYGFGNGRNYAPSGNGVGGYGGGSPSYLGRSGSSFPNQPYRVPTPAFGGGRSYAGSGNPPVGARPYSGYGGSSNGWPGGRSGGFPGFGPRNDHLQSFNGGGHGFSDGGQRAPKSFGGGHSSWGGSGGGGFKAPKASHFSGSGGHFGGGGGHFSGGGGHSGGGHSGGGHGHHR